MTSYGDQYPEGRTEELSSRSLFLREALPALLSRRLLLPSRLLTSTMSERAASPAASPAATVESPVAIAAPSPGQAGGPGIVCIRAPDGIVVTLHRRQGIRCNLREGAEVTLPAARRRREALRDAAQQQDAAQRDPPA